MCGITAIYDPQGMVQPEALRRATAVLHHRGPELQRQWVDTRHMAGLGHARLGIIDLLSGDQPLHSVDNNVHLVVNGEFYDYERLRQELSARGHRFKTHSDSEVALCLYQESGPDCLKQLRGEFVFVLWDDTRQALFAARDRFGIKPLFYAWHQGALYLASEIKALFAAGVPARWNPSTMAQISKLVTHYARQDVTLFEGVYQVPGGHYLWVQEGTVQVRSYWDVDYPTSETLAQTQTHEDDCIALVRERLDEAVRLRMRADVPVGCYLSGGIDSCAVLGLAARYATTPIQAFTLSFDHQDYDERPIAEEMARLAGADFHAIPVTEADLVETLSDAVYHAETVFFNAHGVAKFLLSRAVRDAGFKVVLTGEGSDEIFAGYPPFRRDMLLYNTQGQDSGDVQRLLGQLQQANQVSSGMLVPHGQAQGLDTLHETLGFIPSWLESFATGGAKLQGLLSEDFRAVTAQEDVYRQMLNGLDVAGQMAGRDAVHQSLYLWKKFSLTQYVLVVLGDRMEMAHSIEGRLAFLDHPLVEAVRQLPVHLKIRGVTEKYVLREAVRPFVTDTVYRRHKHPFFSPPAALSLSGPLFNLMQSVFHSQTLRDLPFFDQARVCRLMSQLPEMDTASRTAYDTVLMIVLSACLLHNRYSL